MASASAPPPPPPPGNGGSLLGSSAVTTAKEFLHSISQNLTNSNYLLWCQQVEPVLKGHHLFHLLTQLQIPPEHLTIADRDAGVEFLLWEQQDQLLLLWLESTISAAGLPRLVSCKTVCHLWDKLHMHFHSIVRAKKQQLRNDLRTFF